MMPRYDSDATAAAKNSAGALAGATPMTSRPAQQITACSTASTAKNESRAM